MYMLSISVSKKRSNNVKKSTLNGKKNWQEILEPDKMSAKPWQNNKGWTFVPDKLVVLFQPQKRTTI